MRMDEMEAEITMKKSFKTLLALLLAFVLTTGALSAFAEGADESAEETLCLPAALKIIDEEAFYRSESLRRVVIPEGVQEIRARAFAESGITEIEFPSTLTFIAEDAFDGCEQFDVTVPEDCYAFEWCVEHGLVDDPSVYNEPTGVFLPMSGVNLSVGEEITLQPTLTSDEIKFNQSLTYSTSDIGVATVDENGVVIAQAVGEAEITVTTVNGLKAVLSVAVVPAQTVTSISFGWESATIVAGDHAALEMNLNADAIKRGYSLTSSAEEVLSVDAEKLTITAHEVGSATITLSVNPVEEGENTELIEASVTVIEGTDISFSADELNLWPITDSSIENSLADLTIENLPEDLIGVFEAFVEDEDIAFYDAELGMVQALDETGVTRVCVKTYNQEIYCTVTVAHEPTHRALIIGEFNNSGASNDLPFASNNLNNFYNAINGSKVDSDGRSYEKIVKMFNNPNKTQVLNAIESTFEDAREGDVSVIYIVSHGYDVAANGGYHFGMSNYNKNTPSTYIGHEELMNTLLEIQGDVVLIIDSCKSGGFIRDEKTALEQAGNIAVLTAQYAEKNASFYNGQSNATKVEFLTYILCEAMGYRYNEGTMSSLPGDSNNDKFVSVTESFNYCVDNVPPLVQEKAASDKDITNDSGFIVPGVKTQAALEAWLGGTNPGQKPQIYIPSDLKNVVIYGR